jgi:hypothetical protein
MLERLVVVWVGGKCLQMKSNQTFSMLHAFGLSEKDF